MLHRQKVHVQKSINAVLQTSLFRSVELAVLDRARHALCPADLRQAVCLYSVKFVSHATLQMD